MIYLSYRVFKIVKFSEPMYLSMLICLELSLIFQMVFFGYQARLIRKDFDVPWDTYVCITTVTGTLPAIFIAIATLINCVKWLNFLLRMRSLTGIEEDSEQMEEKIQQLEVFRKRINAVAGFIMFVIVSVIVYYYFKGCLGTYDSIEELY